MKIAFGSDLHQEFWRKHGGLSPIEGGKVDVLVAAGDIDKGSRAPQWLRETYGAHAKHILFVQGNHENYGGEIGNVAKRIAEESEAHGVTYLRPGVSADIDGVRFIGATLWTDYLYGRDPALNMMFANEGLNDHRVIRIKHGENAYSRFRPQDARALHDAHRKWIMDELAKPFDGKTVVVTHHAPHSRSISPGYEASHLNAAFVSDILEKPLPGPCDLWIHGHVHSAHDYVQSGVRVVANPRGYPGELYDSADDYSWRVIEL